ncbi:MAG: site-2 protease family protein, partial [Pseudomonadota bacterium]|nr:site-2 protease family protein [Pseudomonadota bacterium]
RVSKVYYDPITAIGKGVLETTFIITQTFRSLGGIISGRESADALGGPVKIAQISGQMASLGWVAVFNWIALISVSIGLINLFPIPMLDGGHLLFYSYEAVIGKPMPEKVQEYSMRAGLAFVIMLFVFVTWNDVSNISLFN